MAPRGSRRLSGHQPDRQDHDRVGSPVGTNAADGVLPMLTATPPGFHTRNTSPACRIHRADHGDGDIRRLHQVASGVKMGTSSGPTASGDQGADVTFRCPCTDTASARLARPLGGWKYAHTMRYACCCATGASSPRKGPCPPDDTIRPEGDEPSFSLTARTPGSV
jgi:hypothetical protein